MFTGEERRAYVRDPDFYKEAYVSTDGEDWTDIVLTDLSAGGFKFNTELEFKVHEILWFRAMVYALGGGGEEVKGRGVIMWRRQEKGTEGVEYGVKFYNIKPEAIIRIDEIVKHNNRFANSGLGDKD
ncbi:MAG: PilZ domain-containing protein [Oscillospiraceae bacterium]|nr:PilZ domain-containing protein [Oscillospiraceae bacterium]